METPWDAGRPAPGDPMPARVDDPEGLGVGIRRPDPTADLAKRGREILDPLGRAETGPA